MLLSSAKKTQIQCFWQLWFPRRLWLAGWQGIGTGFSPARAWGCLVSPAFIPLPSTSSCVQQSLSKINFSPSPCVSPPVCPTGALGPCCLPSPCWAGAEQFCCSFPQWGSCALAHPGAAESKQVNFRCLPSLKVIVIYSDVALLKLCCEGSCCSLTSLLCTCFLYTSHFFLYHHMMWTPSSRWLHGTSHRFSFPVVLLKHKVRSRVGCPSADTLSVTSRRTKTVVPWKVNLDLGFNFKF